MTACPSRPAAVELEEPGTLDVDDRDVITVVSRFELQTLAGVVQLVDQGRYNAAVGLMLVALIEAGAPVPELVHDLRDIVRGQRVADVLHRTSHGEQDGHLVPETLRVSRHVLEAAVAEVPSVQSLFRKVQAVHRGATGSERADLFLDVVR